MFAKRTPAIVHAFSIGQSVRISATHAQATAFDMQGNDHDESLPAILMATTFIVTDRRAGTYDLLGEGTNLEITAPEAELTEVHEDDGEFDEDDDMDEAA